MITKRTKFRNERIGMKPLIVDLTKPVALSAVELQRQRTGAQPDVVNTSDDLAETSLRMKDEAVIVSAERMASATARVWLRKSAFVLMHVACLGVFFTGVNVQDLALCGSVYLLQMVGITIGHHRLPSLLVSPLVQDEPRLSVRACLAGVQRRAERAALVGA
jgi:hypothetical protein